MAREPDTVVIRPRAAQIDSIRDDLTDYFEQARAALLDGKPVIFEVLTRDLFGQGSIADAAVAGALLGLEKTLALEGVKPGWSVNVVAVREAGEAAALSPPDTVSGQLIYSGTEHLGKVPS